jgi:hypothetical protein
MMKKPPPPIAKIRLIWAIEEEILSPGTLKASKFGHRRWK